MKRILIIDDEPNIVMALEYAFRKKGYEVYIGRNGQEAITLSKKYLPDLILLDIMMPKMDGYESIRILRKIPEIAHARIIFLSAKSKTQDVEKGFELKADDYITKPFSVRRLLNRIDQLFSES